MRRTRRTAGANATAVTALAALLAVPSAGTARAAQPECLTIDLANDTGAFRGGASGSPYGVYGDGVPSRNVVEGGDAYHENDQRSPYAPVIDQIVVTPLTQK
ncbi:hypothetical protein ABZY09_28065 [Streptomyces sp. NPDC002928]|uniref:hypothetical protein n=1 Tax=Streptomyces sp. NPDC002928 TaxID=3154440 RepID=UPI0033A0E3E7